MRIFDFGPFAKDGVSLIEKENGVAVACLAKNSFEVFLCLPNIFIDYTRKVDLV